MRAYQDRVQRRSNVTGILAVASLDKQKPGFVDPQFG